MAIGGTYFGGREVIPPQMLPFLLVRISSCLGLVHPALPGQPGPANLIEQGAVADFQRDSSSFAIPTIGFEDAQDNLAFEIVDRLASHFLEMNLAFQQNFGNRMGMLPTQ